MLPSPIIIETNAVKEWCGGERPFRGRGGGLPQHPGDDSTDPYNSEKM